MTIADILYLIDARNRPGRNSLVAVAEQPFDTGTQVLSGAQVNILLPTPQVGFVRLWEFANAFIGGGGLAANDTLQMVRQTPNAVVGCLLFSVASIVDNLFPLIGGRRMSASVYYEGIDRLIVSPTDIIKISATFNAPVAQTMSVQGYYKDLPF